MKKRFQTLLRYRFLLQDLTMRDLKVKYRRSVLGLLWSILNPLLMMVVVTTVFQNVLRVSGSEEIKDFSIFYLTGSLIFNFVSEATTGALNSIVQYSSLIKKVYIPKYIFPIEKCMFAFVNLLFSMIALVIMFVIRQTPIHWTVVLFPIPLIYTFVFSIGLGLILAALNVFFRDVGLTYRAWSPLWAWDYRPEGFQWLGEDQGRDGIFLFLRRDDRGVMLAVFQFLPRAAQRAVSLPGWGGLELLLSTGWEIYGGPSDSAAPRLLPLRDGQAVLPLPPYSGQLYRLLPPEDPVS